MKKKLPESVPKPYDPSEHKENFDKFAKGKLEKRYLSGIIWHIGKNCLYDYEARIAAHLQDSDDEARRASVMVLGLLWKRKKYKGEFIERLLYDEDWVVRCAAATALEALAVEHKDHSIGQVLLGALEDKKQPKEVRVECYCGLLHMCGIHPRELGGFVSEGVSFEKDIDMDFVRYAAAKGFVDIDLTRLKKRRLMSGAGASKKGECGYLDDLDEMIGVVEKLK